MNSDNISNKADTLPELLAPAGCPEAGYAALQYGADAVYLGLNAFSARASAQNFTPDELLDFSGYAHSLPRPSKVFVTLNTLAQQRQLGDIIEALHAVQQAQVDALIVQDMGICRIIQEHFPNLRIHASTQMAIHNPEGARALVDLGIKRVTLARELTIKEITEICTIDDLEVEAFIHGALCYSYSGLCFFSSMVTGRSANRGRCAYPCRGEFHIGTDSSDGQKSNTGHLFSMKDLTLKDCMQRLLATGVDSLKIEGRMKSPLYVAAVVDMYRKLLDGNLDEEGLKQATARVQSVYSRETTTFFVSPDKKQSAGRGNIIDPKIVGHRGAPCGVTEKIVRHGSENMLCFTTSVDLQRYDGLQIDLPGQSEPYGFSLETLKLAANSKRVFVAPADSSVEITLPAGHPPIPKGSKIYRSSSQEVKQTFKIAQPRPGEHKVRQPMDISLILGKSMITVAACIPEESGTARKPISFSMDFPLEKELTPAKNPEGMTQAARGAFEKTGDTPFSLNGFTLENPENLFAPVSLLNKFRREILDSFSNVWETAKKDTIEKIRAAVCSEPQQAAQPQQPLSWSVKTDNPKLLPSITAGEAGNIDEAIFEISTVTDTTDKLLHTIEECRQNFSGTLRISLPPICRAVDRKLLDLIKPLLQVNCSHWEVSNLWGWYFIRQTAGQLGVPDVSLTADWPLYALNTQAAAQLLEMGFERFTLSPEDQEENLLQMIRHYPQQSRLCVYQDIPLMTGEACAMAALQTYNSGQQCGDTPCTDEPIPLVSSHQQQYQLIRRNCRSYLLGDAPFAIAGNLQALSRQGLQSVRANFMYKQYTTAQMAEIMTNLRDLRNPPLSHQGNYLRGLQ